MFSAFYMSIKMRWIGLSDMFLDVEQNDQYDEHDELHKPDLSLYTWAVLLGFLN